MMLRIEGAGENALMVYFGAETSPALSAQVQQAARDYLATSRSVSGYMLPPEDRKS